MSIVYPPIPPGAGITGPGSSTTGALSLWADNTGTAVASDSSLAFTGGVLSVGGGLTLAGAITGATDISADNSVAIDAGAAGPAPFLQIASYTLTAHNDDNGDLVLDTASVGHFRVTGTAEVQIIPGLAVTGGIRSGVNIEATGKVIADAGLGVGNSAAATTPGTVVKKIEIFDVLGASLGFIAVYDAIS